MFKATDTDEQNEGKTIQYNKKMIKKMQKLQMEGTLDEKKAKGTKKSRRSKRNWMKKRLLFLSEKNLAKAVQIISKW